MNSIDLNDVFKKNVGEFILTFSEIEFELGILISKIENGLESNPLVPEILGLSLDDKLKRVSAFLSANVELKNKWQKIDSKISNCNFFRRFIAHGIIMNQIPNPSIQGLIKAKSKNGISGLHFKEITNEEVVKNLKAIVEVKSGKNGLGVLRTEIVNWIKRKDNV